jgi:hypothetical protein
MVDPKPGGIRVVRRFQSGFGQKRWKVLFFTNATAFREVRKCVSFPLSHGWKIVWPAMDILLGQEAASFFTQKEKNFPFANLLKVCQYCRLKVARELLSNPDSVSIHTSR